MHISAKIKYIGCLICPERGGYNTMTKAKRVAIYVRVSTDEQTTALQRRELAAWAERAGHTVVKVYEDRGISSAKGRDKHPPSMPCSRQPCGAKWI
jgi:predicted site-specific integrase-resolvase